MVRASQLIGAETRDRQDQKIGDVNNLMIDLSAGRVVEVMIASGRYLGTNGELSAMPPEVLRYNADQKILTMDTTKEDLARCPHFPSSAWPQLDRDHVTAVYQSYHITPYFLPFGPNENAPAITGALQQGTSKDDMDITARIERDIQEASGLSAEAKAVKVITFNGRVTLRGMVANPDEKRRMGQIAARVAPAANVDNQLEVKGASASTAS
jgi:sporulation protein YlmC with PRC-barrel domain